MTVNRDFKRLVRARMQKTGESYTSARARLLQRSPRRHPPSAPAAPVTVASPDPADYAKLAGMSDAAIKAKTGCNWKRWVDALDYHGARDMAHRDIAELVHTKFKVGDWWTQMVTVGYERIRGLRAIGQRRGGGFEASKSRTVSAPLSTLYRAFADARQRQRWLPNVQLTVRTAARNKGMRLGWDDGTLVQLYFVAKGRTKSQVAVQHTNLPDKDARERMKAFWGERLDALVAQVSK